MKPRPLTSETMNSHEGDTSGIMYLDSILLIDEDLHTRRDRLDGVVAQHKQFWVADQVLTDDFAIAHAVYQAVLDAGDEGVMLKKPDSLYYSGKRGKNWLKLKTIMEILDIIVVGADWGEGQRANLIDSYLFACYNTDTGEFLEFGRVSTGITDDHLAELTSLFSHCIVSGMGAQSNCSLLLPLRSLMRRFRRACIMHTYTHSDSRGLSGCCLIRHRRMPILLCK